MEINRQAPVVAASEIEVGAGPEVVWDVMAAVKRWPAWNPDVKAAFLEGDVTEGSTFQWKAGPGTITSTFTEVDRPRILAWRGTTLGIRALHAWRMDARNGNTVVRTEESWEGLFPRVFRRSMHKALQRSIDSGLQALKAEVERGPTP
ncbi:MAG: SRPBCC family protein [Actinomycetota bacterium]|nr:SRPBCC family protein [Actinomycetota bacterium]